MTNARKQLHRDVAIGATIAILCLLGLGLRWTYYYDLNDDMLMEQILSGTYTGTPETHNIQNLYPFSLLVSAIYRVVRGVDWYALILLGLAAACYIVTIVRVLQRAGSRLIAGAVGTADPSGTADTLNAADAAAADTDAAYLENARRIRHILQVLGVLGITALYGAVLLYHLVYVQYTVIVGMMGATAAFLILTSEDADNVREFLRVNIAPFVLIFAGYAVRSEMMLFMLPFASLAVLFRILPLRDIRQILLRIAASLLVLGIGVGAIYGIDALAYSSPAWSEFRAVFDARTQLYDFESVPPYVGNEAFYESIGLTQSEAQLLVNYNFGIDADIDSNVLQQVADYAAQLRKAQTPVRTQIKEALWVYQYQKMFAANEMPYNMVSFVLYGLVIIAAVFEMLSAVMDERAVKGGDDPQGTGQQTGMAAGQRRMTAQDELAAEDSCWARILSAGYMILEAILIFAVRSGLWLYLLYSDRPVARLTHSMYYAEALLLLVILFYRRRLDITASLKAAFIACALLYACGAQTTLVSNEAARRETNNAPYQDFLAYTQEHPDAFYVVDVYSTVDFSEEMFDNNKVTVNWDLCGGWASKSPLESTMLAAHGVDSIQDGLISEDDVYFVARAEYDTEWIVNYYADKGVKVVVNRVDMIGEYWGVYTVDTWEL